MGMIVAPYRLASGVVTDPSYSSVVFLSGFNRTPDSSSAFTDEAKGRTVTSTGSTATTAIAQSKFGISSLLLQNANTDYWWLADNADFTFGSGAFTVETWVRFTTVATVGNHIFMGQYDNGLNQRGWQLSWDQATGAIRMVLSTNGTATSTVASSAWAPSVNTWYHVAGDYDGSSIYRTYVDGVMKGKTSGSVGTLHDSTSRMVLGSSTNSNTAAGFGQFYMDETRITKGVGRYVSDSGYTTPTAAFPRS